jgi:flagellar biogenesis protein FliO
MVVYTSAFRFLLMIAGILALFPASGWAQGTFHANDPVTADSPAAPAAQPVEQAEKPVAAPSGTGPAALPGSESVSPTAPGAAEAPQPTAIDWEKQTLGQRHRRSSPADAADPQPNAGSLQAPSLWRTTFSLLAVLALIGGGAYLFRRFAWPAGKFRSSRGIDVLARSVINPRQTLCLIKFGQRLLLIGVSPNHMAALDTVENPDEIAHILAGLEKEGPHSISNTFGSLLRREAREYPGEESPAGPAIELEYPNEQNQQWYQARGELANLLDKVKGLSRIHLHRKG